MRVGIKKFNRLGVIILGIGSFFLTLGICLGLAFVSAQLRDVLSVPSYEKNVVTSSLREMFNIILILLFWSSVLLAAIPSSYLTSKTTQNPLNGLVTIKCSIYLLFIPLIFISLVSSVENLLKPNESQYEELTDFLGLGFAFFLILLSAIYYSMSIKIAQYVSNRAAPQVEMRKIHWKPIYSSDSLSREIE
ncbi:MAG: hypothetical protein ACFFAU_17130 [Candidatus Hodarchaeota archaeon]